MSEDLFKNPYKTELYEFEQEHEEPPYGGYGFHAIGRARRRGQQVIIRRTPSIWDKRGRQVSLPPHIQTLDQAHQWMRENDIPGRPIKRVTVRDISTNHSGGGPLEEAKIRDWNGTEEEFVIDESVWRYVGGALGAASGGIAGYPIGTATGGAVGTAVGGPFGGIVGTATGAFAGPAIGLVKGGQAGYNLGLKRDVMNAKRKYENSVNKFGNTHQKTQRRKQHFDRLSAQYNVNEARIKSWQGTEADTDRGGYYHPVSGEWVPPKPLKVNGWTRHDIGIRPPRSPINKSGYVKASTHLDPINKAIFDAREEEARKKAEAKELKRKSDEQLLIRRQQLIDKRQQEIDNPTQPKPRGRPPKKNNSWW